VSGREPKFSTPRWVRPAILAVLIALGATPTLWAQVEPNVERGFTAVGAYDTGGIDHVNLQNGNLVLAIPLASYPTDGALSYGLTLTYNAKVWDRSMRAVGPKSNPTLYRRFDPGAGFNAGLGWTVSLGELVAQSSFFAYRGPDGSEHQFFSTLHRDDQDQGLSVFYTRDGTYLRLKKVGSSGLTYDIEFPEDGTIHRFQRGSLTLPFKLIWIRDRFDNQVTVSQSTTLWTLSDGYRTQQVQFAQVDGQWVVDKVVLTAFGGSAVYDFDYEIEQIEEPCWDTDPGTGNGDGTSDVVLLTAVHLPADGTLGSGGSYVMDPGADYYQGCDDLGPEMFDLPGTLRKIQLPPLGSIEWTYQTYDFPERPGAPPQIGLHRTLGVATKTVRNTAGQCEAWDGVGCTWTYSQEEVTPDVTRRTLVTLPTGDTVAHYFDQKTTLTTSGWDGWQYGLPIDRGATSGAGYFLSREVYDGAPSPGNRKRSTYLGFEYDQLPTNTSNPAEWYATNRRLQRTKTVYHDDGGKFASVVLSSFNGLGAYRHRVTGGSFGDSDVRTEHTEYTPQRGTYSINPANNQQTGDYSEWSVTDPWILGTATARWAQEGSSRVETRMCFEKDTGFLAWVRRLQNGTSPQASDALAVYSRNAAGNLTGESYFGGDPGNLPATDSASPACAVTGVPAAQYRLEHQYQFGVRSRTSYLKGDGTEDLRVLDLTIHQPSALPSRSTDPAGLFTDFEYDRLGRLTWIKPQSGHDAWIEYRHLKATAGGALARTEIRARANGSKTGTIRSERTVDHDGFGRVAWDRVKLPAVGWTKVQAVHNSMGWPFAISERHPDNHPNNDLDRTRFFDYDPFGRPGRINPPDGSAHDVTFSYAGVRAVTRTVKIGTGWSGTSVTETAASTTEVYDRQGRLVRVREPAGLAHAPYQAVYGYDAAHRLRSVTIQPQPGWTGLSQSRSLNYDGRGFLTSESHPETSIVYSDFDALGHPRRIRQGSVNGPFDLRLFYDRVERVTLIEEAGTGNDLKSFTYATANSFPNLKKGKLESATRHNWVLHPGNGNLIDVTVTEDYVYGGKGGRISQRHTSLGTGQTFTQSWSWDDMGRVSSLTYPTCTFAACTPANPTSSTVGSGYADGRLTSVAGFASSITYHSNGTLNQVQHTNGVTFSHGLDPHRMRRPASIGVTGGSVGAMLDYSYDGAGNVTRLGDEIYLYDEIGRVSEARLGPGTQTYQFDAFTNITQIKTTPVGGSTTTQSFVVNAATNRLSASTYDDAGNQTNWGTYDYTFDSLSKLEHVGGSGQALTNIYTPGDERIWAVDATTSPWTETFTLRDLDGKVLRTFRSENGAPGPWQWVEDYVYRGRSLLASKRPSEGTRHFHLDHLGTPRMITNSAGQNAGGFGLYAFGASVSAINTSAERMRFTGHERELGTSFPAHGDDLDYMHARFYSPLTGRFLSVDPIGGDLGMVQSWNRYAYALGNPLKYVDPYGLDEGDLEYSFNDVIDVHEITVVTPKRPLPPRASFPPRSGGGGGGTDSSDSKKDDNAVTAAIRELVSHLPPCGLLAHGATLDLSTINPFTSGGGGSIGINAQYVPGEGYGIYTFSTPRSSGSSGFDIGAALTVNVAGGSGPWSGDFLNAMGSLYYGTFGGFGTPSSQFPEHGLGWHGVQAGLTVGFPSGMGGTVTSYKKKVDLSSLHPWCK
jgi:RHS repeat-associated protein